MNIEEHRAAASAVAPAPTLMRWADLDLYAPIAGAPSAPERAHPQRGRDGGEAGLAPPGAKQSVSSIVEVTLGCVTLAPALRICGLCQFGLSSLIIGSRFTTAGVAVITG